jgi:hypothetical protein
MKDRVGCMEEGSGLIEKVNLVVWRIDIYIVMTDASGIPACYHIDTSPPSNTQRLQLFPGLSSGYFNSMLLLPF